MVGVLALVSDRAELERAWPLCCAEAKGASGSEALYLEQAVKGARHLEVQLAGDGQSAVHLWERDCSLQRRHQKLVELAPAFGLPDSLLGQLRDSALKLASAANLKGLATAEFLVWARGKEWQFAFIEVNPRLQVEHTVTEQITGLDLVACQLKLAQGQSLQECGLDAVPAPRGCAVQLRINAETLLPDGTPAAATGRIAVFEPPSGAGVRVDSGVGAGYSPNPRFDSLMAKLIVERADGDSRALLAQAAELLGEFRLEGIDSNIAFLQSLLAHPKVAAAQWHTGLVEEVLGELALPQADVAGPDDIGTVAAPVSGVVVRCEVEAGQAVVAGQPVLVLESMKMEHLVSADESGVLVEWYVQPGDAVHQQGALFRFAADPEAAASSASDVGEPESDPNHMRPDLEEVLERHAATLDENRPEAVARRRKTGQRTARENLTDICDPDTFMEYGALVIAAQRRRRSEEDLIARTPADGLVAGIGTVNGELFPAEQARCALLSYDYTVLAGTQGQQNHRKKDRLFELAYDRKLPVVLFAEGGGGRPGDTDGLGVAGLDCLAFQYFARLSGTVPLVGICSGRCFAGNAALLGCCDVVIATENSNIGMGGPAMIEGGGLGVFQPEDIGPTDVQAANGVVDLVAADEAEAVQLARKYLAYFQGDLAEWDCPDQRLLRSVIPENRRRVYEVRDVIGLLADTDSVLELRAGFAPGMVTALVRVEGRAMGVIANDPVHQAGAIESVGADKASRFMQLCDAFSIPILMLCDTPGIMVGPEAEKTALVRHAARMFVTGASLKVPFFTIVLRKAYGLGAQAMAGGSFKAPVFAVSWPTGEFGGMGLEGAVRLGYRRELEAVEDPAEREQLFEQMVERMYRHGKALNTASHFEIDAVIDPAESRQWIVRGLRSAGENPQTGGHRPFVDTW